MTTLTRTQTFYMAEHHNGYIYIVERTPTRVGNLNRWTWSRMLKVFKTLKDGGDALITARSVPLAIRKAARLHFDAMDLTVSAEDRDCYANMRDALKDARIFRGMRGHRNQEYANKLEANAIGWASRHIAKENR